MFFFDDIGCFPSSLLAVFCVPMFFPKMNLILKFLNVLRFLKSEFKIKKISCSERIQVFENLNKNDSLSLDAHWESRP